MYVLRFKELSTTLASIFPQSWYILVEDSRQNKQNVILHKFQGFKKEISYNNTKLLFVSLMKTVFVPRVPNFIGCVIISWKNPAIKPFYACTHKNRNCVPTFIRGTKSRSKWPQKRRKSRISEKPKKTLKDPSWQITKNVYGYTKGTKKNQI